MERIGRWDPERRRRRMRESFDPAATRLIEDAAGTLLGCVTIRHGAAETEVSNLYLEPAAQGRGLGRAVMAAIAAERPTLPVRLEVLRQSGAQRFYERLGFAVVAEQEFDRAMLLPARV
nr:GNAT family N-acetyltransferase [Roseomonas sp. GC11]